MIRPKTLCRRECLHAVLGIALLCAFVAPYNQAYADHRPEAVQATARQVLTDGYFQSRPPRSTGVRNPRRRHRTGRTSGTPRRQRCSWPGTLGSQDTFGGCTDRDGIFVGINGRCRIAVGLTVLPAAAFARPPQATSQQRPQNGGRRYRRARRIAANRCRPPGRHGASRRRRTPASAGYPGSTTFSGG